MREQRRGVGGSARRSTSRHADPTATVLSATFFVCVTAWAVIAVEAAVAPNSLPRPVWSGLGLRRDTLGFSAFIAAGVAYALRQLLEADSADNRRLPVALLRTTRLFGALVAGYITLMAFSHPHTLSMQMTHLMPYPSERVGGLIGGGAAVLAHLALRRLASPRQRLTSDPHQQG